ncbi:hypothetical protein [Phaeobacter sp. 11ANDIMAR09]|uniref:hypothetical protein n=1 Tax=Phaeobacter sp. 11ANDIMAR09 TaxID=1225647 RepID=UPI0006C885E5|nr:hypothetical protein [Phaeobacter sp. 11ANDIMAR09]KPD12335.1 hypothetical protein AN476_10475 [Phaeobacter sp. 11ANDIMAR09]
MSAHSIEVTRLNDGQVMLRKGTWQDVFPEGRREPWAQWYDAMFAEYGYPGYRAMAEALRALPA